jgi:uncharacterized protein involved in tolerance to divalent cations
MIAKTKEQFLDSLLEEVRKNHSYDVFETICMPIVGGNKKYLEWIDKELGADCPG